MTDPRLNDDFPTDGSSAPSTSLEPIRPSNNQYRLWWPLTIIASAIFLTVGAWASYHAELRNDQYQLIHLGQSLYHGKRLYVDCWENKPPGIALISFLGLLATKGDPMGAWLPLAPMALAAVALWGATIRKLFGDATACVSMLMCAVVYSLRLYDTPSINPDFYSSIIELAAFALWCYAKASVQEGRSKGRRTWYFACILSGFSWLAATSFKQVGCLGLLAVTLIASVARFRVTGIADPRIWWRGTLIAWSGFVFGLLLVVPFLVQVGAREAWLAIVSFNTSLADPVTLLSRFARDFMRMSSDLEPLLLPMWLALMGVLLTLRSGSKGNRERALVFVALVWLVLAAIFAMMGPSRAMRYWLALFPPMLFLAAVGVTQLIELYRTTGTFHRTTVGLVLISIVFVLARPLHDSMKTGIASSVASWQKIPNERDRLRAVGEEVRRRTKPEDRIYVWGFNAGVYVYSDRFPASRFVYPRSPQQADEILSALEEGRAKLLMLPKGGNIRFDPSCDETCEKRFEQVISGCEASDDIGNYRSWVCK